MQQVIYNTVLYYTNTVYANENKIMRRNTKKMSRFIVYIVVNPYICSGDT